MASSPVLLSGAEYTTRRLVHHDTAPTALARQWPLAACQDFRTPACTLAGGRIHGIRARPTAPEPLDWYLLVPSCRGPSCLLVPSCRGPSCLRVPSCLQAPSCWSSSCPVGCCCVCCWLGCCVIGTLGLCWAFAAIGLHARTNADVVSIRTCFCIFQPPQRHTPCHSNPARAILILRPQGLRFKSRRSGIRRKRAGAQPHGVAVPCERERGSRSCLISFSHASPVGRCFGRRGGTPSSAAVPRKHSTYSSLISTATRISGSTGLD